MAGRELTPATPPDLLAQNLAGLNGERVADVARSTLKTGQEVLAHWGELKPVVEKLTKLVREHVDAATDKTLTVTQATNLLATVANVVDKVAKASQGILKTSESQSRLVLLLHGGAPKRPDAKQLSEKQLANVVIEAAKRMKMETGVCPICAAAPLEAEVVS